MNTRQQNRFSSRKIFSYVYLIIFIFSILVSFFVSWFLYKNFYQSIAESKEIIALRSEVAMEDVNMKRFETIIEEITKKLNYSPGKIKINF